MLIGDTAQVKVLTNSTSEIKTNGYFIFYTCGQSFRNVFMTQGKLELNLHVHAVSTVKMATNCSVHKI